MSLNSDEKKSSAAEESLVPSGSPNMSCLHYVLRFIAVSVRSCRCLFEKQTANSKPETFLKGFSAESVGPEQSIALQIQSKHLILFVVFSRSDCDLCAEDATNPMANSTPSEKRCWYFATCCCGRQAIGSAVSFFFQDDAHACFPRFLSYWYSCMGQEQGVGS
jgi:hypothetical protein